jgi:hypothetical protein
MRALSKSSTNELMLNTCHFCHPEQSLALVERKKKVHAEIAAK